MIYNCQATGLFGEKFVAIFVDRKKNSNKFVDFQTIWNVMKVFVCRHYHRIGNLIGKMKNWKVNSLENKCGIHKIGRLKCYEIESRSIYFGCFFFASNQRFLHFFILQHLYLSFLFCSEGRFCD